MNSSKKIDLGLNSVLKTLATNIARLGCRIELLEQQTRNLHSEVVYEQWRTREVQFENERLKSFEKDMNGISVTAGSDADVTRELESYFPTGKKRKSKSKRKSK